MSEPLWEWLRARAVEIHVAENLCERLRRGEKLRVKLGVDPTAPDLHVGHLVVFDVLRAFQEEGHVPVLIVGDYTAMIGDPSGRSETRPVLSREQVEANARTYFDQIYKVLSLHQSRLEGARITVQTDFGEVPEIWADSNQLQEALFHLVQNAEQAMSAARGSGTLAIRVRPAVDGVRIEVADDGPGVPQDDLARVFNPFFTTKGPGEGRGLGLSVAHSVVAEHEGRLWAENRPGGGAMFVMELPVGSPAPDPALAPSA